MIKDYFRTEDGVTPWGMWCGLAYRAWMRFIHHLDYHKTTRIGPMDDGRTIHKCSWCGASRIETPMWLTEQMMREKIDRALQETDGCEC